MSLSLDKYRHYPALLAVWVSSLAATSAAREDFLGRLLLQLTWRPWTGDRTPKPAVHVLNPLVS